MARTIFSKEESLEKIKGWDFYPKNDKKIRPIVLTLPQMTVSELDAMVHRHATRCYGDGDALPGNATIEVLSEPMARELIESYGSKLIKTDVFIDASAL